MSCSEGSPWGCAGAPSSAVAATVVVVVEPGVRHELPERGPQSLPMEGLDHVVDLGDAARRRRAATPAAAARARSSVRTRLGCRVTSASPVIAPPLLPSTSAQSAPRASRRAARSSARRSGVESCSGSSRALPEMPRGSWVTTVKSSPARRRPARSYAASIGAPMIEQHRSRAADLVVQSSARDVEGVRWWSSAGRPSSSVAVVAVTRVRLRPTPKLIAAVRRVTPSPDSGCRTACW